jgi:hypothetical protein
MPSKKHNARIALSNASDILSDEIWGKKWDHIPTVHTKPICDCVEIIKELENRCPGHSIEEYQNAISRAMFHRR